MSTENNRHDIHDYLLNLSLNTDLCAECNHNQTHGDYFPFCSYVCKSGFLTDEYLEEEGDV